MTFFIQSGDTFSPTPGKESMLENLPVGNYIVIETMLGLKFQRTESFEKPGRMYGNITKRAERIINTFEDRHRTTGVLLAGEKGSGKSQLARLVSRLGYEKNMPTITINAPFYGDAFNQLLSTIEQPAIILMDEFEKVYAADEQQEQILTLLDGAMTSKKLFLLTVNNKYRVNDHMKNRPGRIFYSIDFKGLEVEFIREYCADNLDNQNETENIVKISALFNAFNFDMLKAIVEEMNRYKETAFEALDMLNAKPMETYDTPTYEVVATSPSGMVSETAETTEIPLNGHSRGVAGVGVVFPVLENPDYEKVSDDLDLYIEDLKDGDWSKSFAIYTKQLKGMDVDAGKYKFEVNGFTLLYTRKPPVKHTPYDFLGM